MDRVQKLMSNYGYCSRRKAETLIEAGKVTINGKVAILGDKAGPEDTILVNGQPLKETKKVYIKFNKPMHCVTAATDQQHKTVMQYVRTKERVFPIGRLDYNTTGLLLFTNDGDFANLLAHPRYEVKKTYLVEVDKPVKEEVISQLQRGVPLEDGRTRPAQVRMHSKFTFSITIHEGKNRIVRRMVEYLGYKVRALCRTHIGKMSIGTLAPGKWEYIAKPEL